MLDFLVELFEGGASYSAINSARCALSAILPSSEGVSFGALPIVSKFLRGVYNTRPTKSRYSEIWDVKVMLVCLEKLDPPQTLSLLDLSMKLCMLIALVSANRGQAIHQLDTSNMVLGDAKVAFNFDKVQKHSKPGRTVQPLVLHAFPGNSKLCVLKTLRAYLERTQPFRQHSTLFLGTVKPHKPVSRDTIRRWMQLALGKAGISPAFKPHSTRSASVSAAKRGCTVQEILKQANWSADCTFRKFYDKPVSDRAGAKFQAVVLSQ